MNMEVESVKCECCGLPEDCTKDYISSVKASFDGKWLCGLCSEVVRDESSRGRRKSNGVEGSEVVRDESSRGRRKSNGVEEAIKAHMSFCSKSNSNPAVMVADGMRQMLRRRSSDFSQPDAAASPKNYGRIERSSQVGDESSVSFY